MTDCLFCGSDALVVDDGDTLDTRCIDCGAHDSIPLVAPSRAPLRLAA